MSIESNHYNFGKISIAVYSGGGSIWVNVKGESEAVADIAFIKTPSMDKPVAVVSWKRRDGGNDIWEYELSALNNWFFLLGQERSMGKVSHQIKRNALSAKKVGVK